MRIISQVMQLMAKKQIEENRIISIVLVAKETGLTYPTVKNWATGNLRRFDEDAIVAFCKYFNCGIADLLQLEETPNQEQNDFTE